MLTRIANTPRDYAWGSTTLIAGLEGRAPSSRPEAEVWFGDHPGCPSVVADGTGRTLDALTTDGGGRPLPFLLKLLAAGSPLSIQAHPSKEQARVGFVREEEAGIPRDAPERTYRDANHKPELIVALSDEFEALAGLRPLDRTRELVAGLGAGPGVDALRARLDGDDDAQVLRDAIAWLLSADAAEAVADIVRAVRAAADADPDAGYAAIVRIADAYPDDPGVVVALLMNHVRLRRGEALFIAAGVLHAYLAGLGVELMAASDNVLRGGLTGKHVDVAELLRVLDATPAEPPRLEPTAVDGLAQYRGAVDDFRLLRGETAQSGRVALPVSERVIVLVTGGRVAVSAGDDQVTLTPGQAAYAEADAGEVVVTGTGEFFVATTG